VINAQAGQIISLGELINTFSKHILFIASQMSQHMADTPTNTNILYIWHIFSKPQPIMITIHRYIFWLDAIRYLSQITLSVKNRFLARTTIWPFPYNETWSVNLEKELVIFSFSLTSLGRPIWDFSSFQCFFCENKVILIKFMYVFLEIPAFQRS
jgi:hypothetical protein